MGEEDEEERWLERVERVTVIVRQEHLVYIYTYKIKNKDRREQN